MCKFTIEVDFDTENITTTSGTKEVKRIRFDIEPGIITESAIVRFTDLQYYADNKRVQNHNFTSTGKVVIATANSVTRNSQNMIKLIECYLDCDTSIDRIQGNITIDMNNGTLQSHTQSFNESAWFYE